MVQARLEKIPAMSNDELGRGLLAMASDVRRTLPYREGLDEQIELCRAVIYEEAAKRLMTP